MKNKDKNDYYKNAENKGKPRILDLLRIKIRTKNYSISTEKTYVDWNKRLILFHNKKHPRDMNKDDIELFLSYLATRRNVSASTQNQALCAILFLFKEVLGVELDWMENVIRAKTPEKVPVVFSINEVKRIFTFLEHENWIMAMLLYGGGLRLMECLRLRVKDIDFDYRQITVREGKGKKDRVTMLPMAVEDKL